MPVKRQSNDKVMLPLSPNAKLANLLDRMDDFVHNPGDWNITSTCLVKGHGCMSCFKPKGPNLCES